jgi:hypothetical protein
VREPWPLALPALDHHSPVLLAIGGATHKAAWPESRAAGDLPAFSVDSIAGVGHYIFESNRPWCAVADREARSAARR